MPESAPGARLSRRTVLRLLAGSVMGAAGASLLSGCKPASSSGEAPTDTQRGGAAGASTPGAGGPDDPAIKALAHRVAADETALLAAYDKALAAHPELAAALAPLRDDHARHLAAVLPGSPTPSAPPTSTPASTVARTATTSAAPTSAAASNAVASSAGPPGAAGLGPAPVLGQLAALEAAAAAARLNDFPAGSGSLARLLASIGGCEAAHASVLRAIT